MTKLGHDVMKEKRRNLDIVGVVCNSPLECLCLSYASLYLISAADSIADWGFLISRPTLLKLRT